MNGSEWGLKMPSEKHMVEFQQHLQKIGAISANGDKSKIDWCGPLRIVVSLSILSVCNDAIMSLFWDQNKPQKDSKTVHLYLKGTDWLLPS